MELEKLIQVVNHLLSKYSYRLNYTKLVKLVYLFTREALLRWETRVLRDDFCSLPQGPVLSGLLNLIKGTYKSRLYQLKWDQYFHREGYDLVSEKGSQVPTEELSPREIALIDELDAKYHSWPYQRFLNRKNKKKLYPEWQDPGDSSQPLTPSDILETHGRTPEEVERILAQEALFDREERYLKSLCS